MLFDFNPNNNDNRFVSGQQELDLHKGGEYTEHSGGRNIIWIMKK